MALKKFADSELLNYLVERQCQPGEQIPALSDLSLQLGINVGKLREQLEVIRTLGLVDVRPRAGIRIKPYEFAPAVRLSVLYALALDRRRFDQFSDLRNHLEMAYLREAVSLLTDADRAGLRALVDRALAKLRNVPFIQIPHEEHRKFHMGIFARLNNPFVLGLLETYWDAYEAVELNAYADLPYWQEAWAYHVKILDCIDGRDFDGARDAFDAHTKLIRLRSAAMTVLSFQGE